VSNVAVRQGKELDMRKIVVVVTAVLAGFAGVAWGQITPRDIEKELALYGNLDQDDIAGGGEVACGPVAAVNSFVYLENKYPGFYDRKLIPDDNPANGLHDKAELISVATVLMGAGYMNTVAPGGTWHDDFIWGKMTYIEEKVPGVTAYQAQDYWAWIHHAQPAWVQGPYPTWQFLFNELSDCEDVEILMSWEEGGHYVTLTSFHWLDQDGDLIIDPSENAWIDFIDPGTGAYNTTSIWQSYPDGAIETSYFGTTASWISMAVSESPIPEPATITLLALGLGAALLRRRMK
jgi:hypothetical protein